MDGGFFTWAGISRDATEGIKVWIALGGIGLAVAGRWLPKRVGVPLLLILSLVSTANYARWGGRSSLSRVDTYDLLHYYINAKYFDELGYLDLYPAFFAADRDNGGPHFKAEGSVYLAQDAVGHHTEPIAAGVVRGYEVKKRFTPERWAAFSHDFLHLQRTMPGLDDKTWRQLINDHGFNGTTVWTAVARPITQIVPVEYVKFLGWIDVVLLVGAAATVGWAFGLETALWTWLFLMVSYSLRWPTITWAFLRYDYVSALLVATALLKKGRPALAAVFAGYSALLRLFPAMWSWGVLPSIRKVPRYFVALALAVGLMQGAAAVAMGPSAVTEHLTNMRDHNRAEQLSSRRIGLALATVTSGELLPKVIGKKEKELIDAQAVWRIPVAVGMLVFGLYALRRAPPWEGFAYGFLPFFLLTTASYYYYVARATLIVAHAGALDRWRNRVGLASLLGMEVFSNWAESTYPEHRSFLIGWLARALAAYTVLMLSWRAWDEAREPAERVGDP